MAKPTFKIFAPVVAVVAFLLLTGCAPNKEYRDDLKNVCTARNLNDCPHSAVQQYVDSLNDTAYTLGFVEFDDQGVTYDRNQLDTVVNYLKKKAATQHLLMVVFAHGWHHGARPGDENIDTFKTVLRELNHTETSISIANHLKPRKVVGVYIGWRGESIKVEGLNNITFWDRKATANQVGSTGVPELLVRLERIKNMDRQVADTSASFKNALITVGHSFGGAVIYSALSQIMVDRFSAERPKKFGDLVVLINPAFEANQFTVLHDMARSRTYATTPNPIMVILTSEGDDATGFWFPVGRKFSTFWEATKSREEKNSIVSAIGHYQRYETHRLVYAEEDPVAAPDTLRKFHRSLAILGSLREQLDSTSDTIQFPGSKLIFTHNEEEGNDRFNPFYVISVDRRIIADHNDLKQPRTLDFVRSMISLTAVSTPLNNGRSINLPGRFGGKRYYRTDSLGYHIRTDSLGNKMERDTLRHFLRNDSTGSRDGVARLRRNRRYRNLNS